MQMTDTKFTPGPWASDKETEVNGILMSEASNLYSRLQDVIYDNQMYGHTTAHTLNEIENAMAKARGEIK
jgi:hypothetical protein